MRDVRGPKKAAPCIGAAFLEENVKPVTRILPQGRLMFNDQRRIGGINQEWGAGQAT